MNANARWIGPLKMLGGHGLHHRDARLPVLVGFSVETILVASLLHHTLEIFFIRLGNRLTSRPIGIEPHLLLRH